MSRATKPGRDGDSTSLPGEARPSGTQRSATFIGSFALLGRLLERVSAFGLIILIASAYGSSFAADLYFIASIAPLLIGSTLGEAIATALLPELVRGETEPDAEARIIASGFWFVTTTLALVTAAYIGVAAIVVHIAAPAGDTRLAPWIAFAPLTMLLGMSGYLAAVLLRYQRYVWPPFRSAFASVGAFAFTGIALAFSHDVTYVAVAVTAGWALSLALLASEVLHAAGSAVFGRPNVAAVRGLLTLRGKTASAAMTGLLGGQVFVLLERLIASTAGVGAVSTLSYARGIAFTPNVLGQAVGSGVYPGMVRAHERGETQHVSYAFERGLRLMLLLGIGIGVYLATFGTPLASAVLQRGKLSADDASAVGVVLSAFALALVGNLLLIITSRTFFAIDYFSAAAWSQCVVLVVYVVVALPLRDLWGLKGLALAFGIAESSGGIASLVFIVRRVRVAVKELVAVAIVPAAARSLVIVGPLLLYRLLTSQVSIPQGLHGVVDTGGSGLVLVVAAVVAVWTARWPETERVKSIALRMVRPAL